MAEKFVGWNPYHYVHNNPINLVDPTGMVAGPGDQFSSLLEAAKDFGQEYNGLSIRGKREITTIFYSYSNADGKESFSYTQPSAGGGWFVDPGEGLKDIDKRTQTVVATGHTHGADEKTRLISVNGKTRHTSEANVFSLNDIDLYNNKIDLGEGKTGPSVFGKQIEGIVITPSGGMLHFDPKKEYSNKASVDSNGVRRNEFDKYINTDMPSDPNSGTMRLNNNSPNKDPKVMPTNW